MQGCLLRLLVIFTSLGVVTVGLGVVFLYQLHDLDPQGWDQGVGQWLEIKVASAAPLYKLSEEEAKAAATHGLNAELVARASAAEAWADEQWGAGAGDRAIYIALTSGESGNCQNCGKCVAAGEYAKRPGVLGGQRACLAQLVQVWKEHGIRASNPTAAKYIPEDYNIDGIIGSCGGGALGCSQFLPCTALPHLDEVGKPFDLWDPNTAAMLMAAELHRLGWNKNASIFTKTRVLLGWNQHYSWVTEIAKTADQYRAYLGTRSGLASIGWLGDDGSSGLQGAVASVLKSLGLMPNIEVLAASTLPTIEGELPTGEGPAALDLLNEVPQNDGEKYNVIAWAKSNQRIEIQPNGVWDFCAQTNTTGWSQYRYAAGINAGGICFNASVLRELAQADSRLKTTLWYPHSKTKWARLHTVITCPGVSFKLQNISDQVLTIVWSQDGDQLFVSVEENEENGS